MNMTLKRVRSGVSAVETAIALSATFVLLGVICDYGLATFRQNTLAASSRWLAREVIVHGAEAAPEMTAWGPLAFSGDAADSSPIAVTASTLLATMRKDDVEVEVEWPDGGNEVGDRVHVTLRYRHEPLLPLLLSPTARQLKAECVMRIAH